MIWFEHPPVRVIDWAKPGKIRQVSSVEAAAEELLKWPKTRKRDKAATLLADAVTGMAGMTKTKKAFDVAAAQELLMVFANTQESHLKYVESILDALDKLSPTEDGSQS